MNSNKKIIMWVLFLSWWSSAVLAADWVVDNSRSQLNFVSVKKGTVGEVHQFRSISGTLDEQGGFTLNIDLASVDTHIPVRDQRMKQYLFEVSRFKTATLTARINPDVLKEIAEGSQRLLAVDAELSLHGQRQPLKLQVLVTRLSGGRLSVVSAQPVLINVKQFSLVTGVNKLKELAKLPSISYVVPITFYLTLQLKY